ncbi:MAG TPA: transcription antitermination factor NusB [Bacteroidales bacterium]|nr:MAG: transcription antitermination factor NusB [Bacteroidetes bacterium GWF2_33_38]OFY90885.1 MAG: transcription antitermination factor NusB [Bacteroidetes bacterium RIFOXYA2_FULL_33_7]HBF88370.1 transcription antitermination factor NusB [Bacteroidales bacterium]
MISRRLLRVKILQMLYAYYNAEDPSFVKYEKDLKYSINKFYDLYHYLMLLIIDVSKFSEMRMEQSKLKRIPTQEDLNPNTRFIDNEFIAQLRNSHSFNAYLNVKKMSWVNYPELVRKLYFEIIESEEYIEYLNAEEKSYKADKKIIIDIFEKFIVNNDFLYQILEEQSIFWNDDVEFAISMIIKTIGKAKKTDNSGVQMLELYKNEEDSEFVKDLFRKTISNSSENRTLIESFIQNWDIERIALIDIIIMQMAVTELKEFSSIPTKVTLNEYIDLAKFYSTSKSGTFINGILDKILIHLKKDNKITKRGRGLIGEV